MTLIKHAFMALFTFLIAGTINAQELSDNQLTDQWTLLQEEEDIQFYVRKEACKMGTLEKPFSYAFVKVVNRGSTQTIIDFNLAVHFENECIGCISTVEIMKHIKVSANSSLETDCSFENGSLAVLIKNPNFGDNRVFKRLELTHFKLH